MRVLVSSVELLRAVDVRYGDDDDFELEINSLGHRGLLGSLNSSGIQQTATDVGDVDDADELSRVDDRKVSKVALDHQLGSVTN